MEAVYIWAALALVLIALEVALPGAFLLWLGLAAAVVAGTLLITPLSFLSQAFLFVFSSFVSVSIYKKYFKKEDKNAPTTLNNKTSQMIGLVILLTEDIENGRGRTMIGDTFWNIEGPSAPKGAHVRIVGARGQSLEYVRVGEEEKEAWILSQEDQENQDSKDNSTLSSSGFSL